MSTEPSQAESPLETVSDVDETFLDRIKNLFDGWVYTPFNIIIDDWRGRIGITLLASYLLMGSVGIYILEPAVYGTGERGISWFTHGQYPLGTDGKGRSVFLMIIHSTPQMLLMVFGGATFSTVVAAIVGLTAGYRGGYISIGLMTITDVMMTLPGLPLLIIIISVLEPQHPVVIGIILSINAWAGLARTLHSEALSLREESFIEASVLMDIKYSKIFTKDILPNVMPYIAINFMNSARGVIFGAVGLYFLGLLPFEKHNWGTLLQVAFSQVDIWDPQEAYLFYVPLLTIIGFSIGLVLLSQSLDALFNPRIRARHSKRIKEKEGRP